MTKHRYLQLTLILGALYYLVGAYVHYFGITLFPWFDAGLYTPYHDSLIALVAVILALILLAVAKNPIKNIDMLRVVIVSAIIGSIFSIAIIWKVDFLGIGAPGKELQTITEGVIGFIWVGVLLVLYPRRT